MRETAGAFSLRTAFMPQVYSYRCAAAFSTNAANSFFRSSLSHIFSGCHCTPRINAAPSGWIASMSAACPAIRISGEAGRPGRRPFFQAPRLKIAFDRQQFPAPTRRLRTRRPEESARQPRARSSGSCFSCGADFPSRFYYHPAA